MPQYRTNEPINYVHDGAVVHVKADRVVELDEAVAKKLGDKITVVGVSEHALMFPTGMPVIDVLRPDPAHDGANEAAKEESAKEAKSKK